MPILLFFGRKFEKITVKIIKVYVFLSRLIATIVNILTLKVCAKKNLRLVSARVQ